MRPGWRGVRWFLAGVGVVVAGAVGAAVAQVLGAPAWVVVVTAGVAAALSLAGQFVWPAFTAREQATTIRWDAWAAAVDPWPWPAAGPAHPGSRLLDARHQVARFRYRRRALADLLDWCTDPASPVHLLLGPAGVGKTRLAMEIAAQLPDGWTIGSAYPEREADAVRAARDLPGHVLVVVDHADTRVDLTGAVREVVRAGAGHVRLLLIARSDEPDRWWHQAFTAVRSTGRADRLAATGRTVLGPVVHTRDDQDQLFAQAVDAFAHQLGVRTPAARMGQVEPDAPIVMIHAAALVAVLRRPGHPVDVDQRLWQELSEHEAGVWQAAAHRLRLDLLADTQRRTVAWAALLGGQDEDTVIGWLARMPDLADAGRDTLHHVAEWLHSLYPGTSPAWLTPVEPAMLADHLVVDELTRGSALADSMLTGLDTGQLARMLGLLGRVAVTEPPVHALVERLLCDAPDLVIPAACQVTSVEVPLDALIAAHVDRLTPDALDRLWVSLPGVSDTVRLLRTVVAVARRRADGTDDVDRLADLADALDYVGRPREAVAAARRSVALGRLHPDRASLANALTSLADAEAAVRQLTEAVAAGREAVSLFRQLADAEPDTYRHRLAAALTTLGGVARYAGFPDDALAADQESVAILRELAEPRPRQLAGALRELGDAERAAGHLDEAVVAGRESVRLLRELTEARPDAHGHRLAGSLNTLSRIEQQADHDDDHLAASREAVRLFRTVVAATGLDAYRHRLGDALYVLASAERTIGTVDRAVVAGRESVRLLRDLSDINPEAYQQCLGQALSTLAVAERNAGNVAEALVINHESVGVLRELAAAHPDAYHPWLGHALNRLAITLSSAGRRDDAHAAGREAVAIWRQLATAHPDGYQRWLGEALLIQTTVHLEFNDIPSAQATTRDAVRELLALDRRLPTDATRAALARARQLLSAITPPDQAGEPIL